MWFLETKILVTLWASFVAGVAGGAALVAKRHGVLRPCVRVAVMIAARAPAAVGILASAMLGARNASAAGGGGAARSVAAGKCEMRIAPSGRREFRYAAFGRAYVVSCPADKPDRRPSRVVCATATGNDGTEWDVTGDVEERLGPQGDCHGMSEGIAVDWIDGAETLAVETLEDDIVLTR